MKVIYLPKPVNYYDAAFFQTHVNGVFVLLIIFCH